MVTLLVLAIIGVSIFVAYKITRKEQPAAEVKAEAKAPEKIEPVKVEEKPAAKKEAVKKTTAKKQK